MWVLRYSKIKWHVCILEENMVRDLILHKVSDFNSFFNGDNFLMYKSFHIRLARKKMTLISFHIWNECQKMIYTYPEIIFKVESKVTDLESVVALLNNIYSSHNTGSSITYLYI